MNIFYLLAAITTTYPASMKKKASRIHKPVISWQSGDYHPSQSLSFEFPQQFIMLCKLVGITPMQLLTDFVDNISCGSWKRQGRDAAKYFLVEYFIEHGYGNQAYSSEDLRSMFKELDAIGFLFPHDAGSDLLNAYSLWREKHQSYFFEKWSR